jgi:G:T-mismatch repair DNA endonuclease (very short patch repair protein)
VTTSAGRPGTSATTQSPRCTATTSWWRLKFRGIARRDRDTDAQLVAAGWLAVRIWEHEDPVEAARAIEQLVRDRTVEK